MAGHDAEVASEQVDRPRDAVRKPEPPDVRGLVAHGTAEDIAALLQQRPGQREQILQALHTQRGNAFVGQVMGVAAAPTAGAAPAPKDDDDAAKSPGPTGTRFANDGKLGDLERGTAELKLGDTGPHVRKVQHALHELGYAPITVTGTFDASTELKVKEFQHNLGLSRADGVLDSETFVRIEKAFYSLRQYAIIARSAAPELKNTPKRQDADHPPAKLMAETHTLGAGEKAEAADAITVHETPGEPTPAFETKKAAEYEKRIEKHLQERIDLEYKDAEKDKKAHDKGKTFSMDTIADVGNASKQSVDSVFGSWATGAKLEKGKNLTDRFETDRAAQAGWGGTKRHTSAASRARYFMNIDPGFVEIDRDYHADRSRAAENDIIEKVVDRIAKKNEEKLLLITATWAAATDRAGNIKIQRLKTGDDDRDRDLLWTKFGSLTHEYIHSLVHPRWHDFRDKKEDSDPQGAHVLAEGVAELLTRIVLSRTNLYDPKLQQQVEGKLYQQRDDAPEVSRSGHYDEAYTRANALVGVVGIYNLYAAYFLGQTQLIGA